MLTVESMSRIYAQVVLNTTMEQAPFPLNAEEEEFWATVAEEVAEARRQGFAFEMIEVDPDLDPPGSSGPAPPVDAPESGPGGLGPEPQPVTAAVNVNPDGSPHTGAMIALVPTDEDIARLAVPGGEPAEQLHSTLLFLGEADDISPTTKGQLLQIAADVASSVGPAGSIAWAVDYFNPLGEEPCWCLGVGGLPIERIHQRVAHMVGHGTADWSLPEQHRPWVPHIAIAYSADAAMVGDLLAGLGPVTFDRIRVAFGQDVTDFPLSGAPVVAAAEVSDEEDDMPFGIRSGGEDCPFEVYNKDTGERKACHETRQEALDHQRALQKNVPDATVQAGIEPREGEHFRAVAHIEGLSTGMRTFTNLTWREPPFSFHWQEGSAAHNGTPQTWAVGLVARVERDPADEAKIYMFGPLDLDAEKGREYGRRLVAGFERWVSIGLDEQPAEVEVVWPDDDGDEDDEGGLAEMLFGEPEQVLIDGGTIGELTGVSVPAQADATIEPTPELVRALSGEVKPAAQSAAVGENECPEGQRWDEELQDCVPVEDEGGMKKKPYAEAGSNTPPTVLRIRTGGSGRITVHRVTEGATSGAGVAPSDLDPQTMADTVQALTAAAYRIEIPDLPPASWYEEPSDIGDIPGAFCVTDEGRIYGVLAPLHVNHRAFAKAGRRMTVPSRNVDYARFLGAEALTASGRIHNVGPITMDCGHANRFRDNGDVAPAHYENACTVVGKIRVGETAQGLPWVAGALEPGVTPDQVSRMLACRLSGDWQPHSDRHGWMELVAALLVPSPGFPMARTGPTVTSKDGVLVASSMPVRFVDSGDGHAIYDGDPREAIIAAAESAGSGEQARRARRFNQWRATMRANGGRA